MLSSADYAASLGRDTVPDIKGLNTADSLPLSTANRTANLYGGKAVLNPPLGGAL